MLLLGIGHPAKSSNELYFTRQRTNWIYHVDTTTIMTTTQINSNAGTNEIDSLAFSPDGSILWGFSQVGPTLYKINQDTGAGTVVGFPYLDFLVMVHHSTPLRTLWLT
jgi:hypothetical protein